MTSPAGGSRPARALAADAGARRLRGAERPLLALATLAALALGAALAYAPESPLARLVASQPPQRPGIARLSRFPHAPHRTERGAVDASWSLVAMVAETERAAAAEPSGPTLHALGVAHLVIGRDQSAIPALREAARRGGERRIAADLAAALVSHGWASESPRSIAEGLELLAARPRAARAPEEAFNEALALELLGLDEQALGEWKAYLARDPSSAWAQEAGGRLERLRERLRASPTPTARELEREVLETLLPAWGEEWLAARPAAAEERLTAASRRAATHASRHGDAHLQRAVDSVRRSGDDRRRRLALALGTYRAARRAYARQDLAACGRHAADAAAALADLERTVAALAELTAASCAWLRNDLAASASALLRAERLAAGPDRGSPLVRGQLAWLGGLVANATGQPEVALRRYEEALAAFSAAADESREAAVRVLLADLFEYLGRPAEAWREAARALPALAGPRRRYNALSTLLRLAASDRFPHVAGRLAGALSRQAEATGDPAFVADSLVLGGRALRVAGDRDSAVAAFRRAVSIAAAIRPAEPAERTLDLARVELAEALADAAPFEAEALARAASEGGDGYGEVATRVAFARARAFRRSGRTAEAEELLRRAVERSAVERSRLGTLEERDRLLDRRERLHRELVDLLVDAGRAGEALAALELWRGEALPRAAAGAPARPPDSLAERSRAAGVEVVSFLAQADELLVWRIDETGTRLERRPIARADLAALVDEAVRDLRSGGRTESVHRLAAVLFGERPMSSRPLVVVPDEIASAIPFAALPAPGRAAAIATVREIQVTPSLGAWLEGAAPVGEPRGCALLVEGARSGGRLFPQLRALGRVEDEFRAVTARHGCAERAATAAAVRAALERRPPIVHYAGHGVRLGSGAGALLLRGDGAPELVDGATVERWTMPGAVVVLSSCAAAEGRPSPIAGRDSLARAFLAAGARAVIASLWPVEDEAGYAMAARLHDRLAAGRPPASALREAQAAAIEEGRPHAEWGGWSLLAATPAEADTRPPDVNEEEGP